MALNCTECECASTASILQCSIGNSSIYLVVNDIGSTTGSDLDFINGYTFLEWSYSVFDTTDNSVGFATTPFTTATAN